MQKEAIITLGISAYFHDSAIALVVNNEVIYAAEEERFSGIKHDNSFPKLALENGLRTTGISITEIEKVVFYEKPFLKFERILETTVRHAPKSIGQFLKAAPSWMTKKLNLRKQLIKELKTSTGHQLKPSKFAFVEHHISHAASAFYPSGFDDATFMILDGVGEWATMSVGNASYKKGIHTIKQQNFPDSLGLVYSCFTYFLGFKVNDGEYKMMGLSPFGDKNSKEFKTYTAIIEDQLITINKDGSIVLDLSYFSFHYSNKMIKTKKWETLFGLKKREKNEPLKQSHANLALAIQSITETIILKLANTAFELSPSPNLVLAGGVAYNCVANGKLLEHSKFDNIWIQPASGDSGGALGAALHLSQIIRPELEPKQSDRSNFLGNTVSFRGIHSRFGNSEKYQIIDGNRAEIVEHIANLIDDNKVVGLIQGAMEFGPRALGARSIIANPRDIGNKLLINREIKGREDFRPFAPVMLLNEAKKYFDIHHTLPYMQFVKKIKPEYRTELPKNWANSSIENKTKIPTSIFGCITHVDFSSRLQVIDNPKQPFHDILLAVRAKTGDGILLNTSFNSGGKPIVNNPVDIFDIFENTPMHALLFNGNLLIKTEICIS